MPLLSRHRLSMKVPILLCVLGVLWAVGGCATGGDGKAPTGAAIPSIAVPTASTGVPDPPPAVTAPTVVTRAAPATSQAPCTLGLAVGDGLPAIDQQTRMSAAIVIVTVERLMTGRWNTPDGVAPSNPCAQHGPPYYGIFTPVLVRVERYVRGELQERELVLSWEVGQVGAARAMPSYIDGYTMDGYREGERMIVFLRPTRVIPPIVAGVPLWDSSFRYIITPDGMVTVRERQSFSRRTIPLEQLLAEIADVR